MDFWTWYVRRGRITRRVFWLHYMVPLLLLSALALAADVALGNTSLDATAADGSATTIEYGPIVVVTGLLTVLPSITAQVTRLHDQGRSGLWVLLNLLPVFGQLAVLGLCGFVPTQPAPNRYGPVPDATGSALPFPAGTLPPGGQSGDPQAWPRQHDTEQAWPRQSGTDQAWPQQGPPEQPGGLQPGAGQSGPWTPGPQDRAPDYPPSDWR